MDGLLRRFVRNTHLGELTAAKQQPLAKKHPVSGAAAFVLPHGVTQANDFARASFGNEEKLCESPLIKKALQSTLQGLFSMPKCLRIFQE